MPPVKLDLKWTIFAVFCFYSLYTPIVSFMWAEKGRTVFQNLREIPVVVFLYFVVPCLALFLLNVAFSGAQHWDWRFVLGAGFVLGVSFFVMLYILTVPDWPIGKLLGIDKVDAPLIRRLLSVNVVGSLLIAVMCGVAILAKPPAAPLPPKATVESPAVAGKTTPGQSRPDGPLPWSDIFGGIGAIGGFIGGIAGCASAYVAWLAYRVSLGALNGK